MSEFRKPYDAPSTFDQRLAAAASGAALAARPVPADSIRRRAHRRAVRRATGAGLLAVLLFAGGSYGLLSRASNADVLPGVPTSTEPQLPVATFPASSPWPTVAGRPSSAGPPTGNPSHPSAASVGSAASPANCALSQLDVALGTKDASSGHRSVAVVFRNTGRSTCRLTGYPGVDALDAGGATMEHARRTLRGYEGGVSGSAAPAMALAPGQSASSLVEALAYRSSDGSACPPYAALLVTPPNDVSSVRLSWQTDGCSELQVHPVVPGASGLGG